MIHFQESFTILLLWNVYSLDAFVPPEVTGTPNKYFHGYSSSSLLLQPDGFVQGGNSNGYGRSPVRQDVYGFQQQRQRPASSPPPVDDEPCSPMVRAGLTPDGFPIEGLPMNRMDPSAPRQPPAYGSTSTIQGAGSRATFSSPEPYGSTDGMDVHLGTMGRPLQAVVSNWRAPNDTPTQMRLYSEDGGRYPWMTKFNTPQRYGGSGVTEIRNVGPMEFPLEAAVTATTTGNPNTGGEGGPSPSLGSRLSAPKEIHGGDLTTFGFDPDVQHVYVEISSEGMPIYAKVELYQGPMNAKAIADIYTDSGVIRPWSAVIPMPGPGASICILNEGPMAYPLTVRMDPSPRSISF